MGSPPRLVFGTSCAWRERVWYPALLRQLLEPTPPSDAEEAWGVARSEPKKTWVDAALRKGMTGSGNKAGSSFSLRAVPVDSRGKLPTGGIVRSSPRMRSEASARIACVPVSMETSAEPPRNFVFYSLEYFKAEIFTLGHLTAAKTGTWLDRCILDLFFQHVFSLARRHLICFALSL